MIKKEELRVNNVVKSICHKGLIAEIHSLTPTKVKLWCNPIAIYSYDEIDGIPLTPQILEKCGFHYSHETNYYQCYNIPENNLFISLALKDMPEGYGAKEGQWYIGENHVEIPSMHWLQNYIYFNHNGYELTVKL